MNLQIKVARIDAGNEGIDLHAGRRASDVDRRKSATGQGANAARTPETRPQNLLQFALQPLELGNGIARQIKKGLVHDKPPSG
ncbi:hypothetical protein D9M70_522580 [compost metagenome]